jgi:isoquinoline 1-oxidoreductase alpha subunit
MITLNVNGQIRKLDVEGEMPLLWALRDELGLTGTKYGCGIGQCGACTVNIDGAAVRSCGVGVSDAQGAKITTIEALAAGGALHPVQQAWLDEDVPQCGYCQSGQIMAAVALLRQQPHPSDSDIDTAMSNICRCGTYPRIRAAIHRAISGASQGQRHG